MLHYLRRFKKRVYLTEVLAKIISKLPEDDLIPSRELQKQLKAFPEDLGLRKSLFSSARPSTGGRAPFGRSSVINSGLVTTWILSTSAGTLFSNVLWRWNETDTSQFTRTTGDATMTVSTMEGVPGQPALLLSGTKSASTGFWYINDLDNLPARYLIGFTIDERDTGFDEGGGILYCYQDPSHWLSVFARASTNLNHSVATSTTGSAINNSITWNVEKAGVRSGNFRFLEVIRSTSATISGSFISYQSPQEAPERTNYAVPTIWGSGSTLFPGTGWDFSQANKAGICFNPLSAAYSPGSQYSRIGHFVIMKHPLDWVG